MTDKEQKASRIFIYILIAIILFIVIITSIGLINITVLDTKPFENLTLSINIT